MKKSLNVTLHLICSALATRMTLTRFHVVAIAAGLLLAMSGPSFAAKRMSDTKSAVKSQSRAVKFPYPYSRDDPYAPGVNWPGKW
jgi:hypothetical protein